MKLPRIAPVCTLFCLSGIAALADSPKIKHVLVISVDGMHQSDFDWWVQHNPASALGKLAAQGVRYSNASTTKPSDSIPATIGIFSGATAAVSGLYYDDAYNRSWFAPANTACAGTPGTVTSLKQDIDWDSSAIDGGASAHGGQGINPALLPRQIRGAACVPVYPHNMVRVNNVFEVVKRYHGRTAFAEKRPAYEFLQGPSGTGVDDLFLLEINFNNTLASVSKTETFDDLRAKAVINWIDGMNSAGTTSAAVPTLFGMNFQAINSAKKVSLASGYADSLGTPDATLLDALGHTDASIGNFVAELTARSLTKSTAIILTAKHGESPLDPTHRNIQLTAGPTSIAGVVAAAGITPPKITQKSGTLIWLTTAQQAQTSTVVNALLPPAVQLAGNFAQILSGSTLQALFPNAATDPAAPDVVVIPNLGTNYEPSLASTTKAEHGGFGENETHVPLLVVYGSGAPGVVKAPVTTTQIAPTILDLLGMETRMLQGVQLEGVGVLPGIRRSDD